jgi:hypothetical protein
MSLFRATAAGITAKFGLSDARLLANLATQIAGLLAGRDELQDDPAIERLLPDAYRDSDSDAAEFRHFTETDLADDKIRSALGMAELLTPEESTDDKVRVTLDHEAAFDWMRSFTDIRLALATRLGIVDDTSPIMVDEETSYTLAVYTWLGELQYSLVKAIDR